MSGAFLPHALLDLTLARASARLETLASQSLRRNAFILGRRYAHQSVSFADVAPAEYVPLEQQGDRSFYSRYVVPFHDRVQRLTSVLTRRQISRHKPSPVGTPDLFPYGHNKDLTELERRIAELKEEPIAEVCTFASCHRVRTQPCSVHIADSGRKRTT